MAVTDTVPSTTYPALFRTFIEQTLRRSLAQVQACGGLLPDDIRDQALHALSFGLKHTINWPLTRALLLCLGPQMEQIGYRYQWLPFLTGAITSSESMGDLAFTAECQLQIATLYRLLSQFEQAHCWAQASLANFTQLAHSRDQARVLNELAWLAQLQKDYKAAASHVEQALALLDDDDSERGMSYRVYGMIRLGEQGYADAEHYHRQALGIFQNYGDARRTAWSLQNIGLTLSRQRQYQAALAYYEQANGLLTTIQDPFHWAAIQFNQGLAYSFMHQYRQAIACYQQAEDVFRKLDEKYYLSRLYTDLGLDLLELHEYARAEHAFQASAQLAESLNDMSWQLNAMDGLAMAYLNQQKSKEAKQILETARSALASIQGDARYERLLRSIEQHLQLANEMTSAS
ncbi:MAG: tetratricopeptide repeat protein [Caldilineaceae bacterium]|nr:tetratricopeptide repeat protein [Caldilineaceae bacterium]